MCLILFSSYEPRFTLTWCNLYTKHMLRPDIQNGPVKCLLLEALLTFDILWSAEELLQRSRCAGVPSSNGAACAIGKSFRSWGLGRFAACCQLETRAPPPEERGGIEATHVVVWVHECVWTSDCAVPHSVFAGECWDSHAVTLQSCVWIPPLHPSRALVFFQSCISDSD